MAIKNFKKPALDLIETYTSKMKEYNEYTIEQKIYIIKCIIYSLFDLSFDDKIDIDKIYLSTDKPIISDDFSLFTSEFVNRLDKNKINKKTRDNMIKYIADTFDKLKYNKYKKILQ